MSQAANGDYRLIREISLQNLLSYGPAAEPIALGNLNVLIGPNGSGKSNLIEAISLLQAAPTDLRAAIRRGGGVAEWIWKGAAQDTASIDVVVNYRNGGEPLNHKLTFENYGQQFRLAVELIHDATHLHDDTDLIFYSSERGSGVLKFRVDNGWQDRPLSHDNIAADQSILAQRREPESLPQITYLGEAYEKIRIYREWAFGRNAVYRYPQKADMRTDRLEEDLSNLALVLNRLRQSSETKRAILTGLQELYEGITDYDVSVDGGTVQVYLSEGGSKIPATRLSDGTLRYLCLLAILCQPKPPPLICIEEPELGLHPDILPKLADMLVSASERTQLIITTHSDILVDALSDMPEAILVCEKHNRQTHLRRLESDEIAKWLENYRLGELWLRGELEGTRW